MTGPACPVEGCDYNEDGEKTAASVRRHINAKTDDAHSDTEALRSALNRPDEHAEGAESTPDEGAQGAPDDTEDDEQGEAAEEGAQAAEEQQNDHEEDSMPTEDEYTEQYENQQDGDDDEGGSQNSESESGSFLPALNRSTVILLVGVLAVLLLAYVVINRDSDSVSPSEAVEQDIEDSSDADAEEVTLIEQ